MLKRMLIGLKNNWLLFVIVAFFTISIISFEVISNNYRTQKTLSEVGTQLTTLAELKAVQLQNWRSERINDGQIIQTDVDFSNVIRSIMQDPSDQENIKKCMESLRPLLADPNYSSILLLDDTGEEILRVGEIGDKPGDLDIGGNPEIQMSSLHKASDGTVQMDLVVPIFYSGDQHQTLLAYLIYIINPDVIVYPLIQSLPTAYNTAETLLVHKENTEVVFLNELRFRKETALELRIPIDEAQNPAVMAVNGITGIVNGNDYRSVPVLATIVPIEGTDWKLIAKIDMEEIYIPIRQQVVSTTMVVIFLIIIGVASVVFLWRRQSASITTGLSISEKRMRNLQEKYSNLFNQANDAILLIEENGKILEVNDQAIKMYGYTREELVNLSISDLRDEKSKLAIQSDMVKVKKGATNIFEVIHKRKNGELFRVDVSSKYLTIDGKGLFQSLIRDITEKKQAEEKLKESEERFRTMFEQAAIGVALIETETGRYLDINKKYCDFIGYSKNEMLGFSFSDVSVPEDAKRNHEKNARLLSGEINDFSMEKRYIRKGGEIVWGQLTVSPLWKQTENPSTHIHIAMVEDITKRKQAEVTLKESEANLKKAQKYAHIGSWLWNIKTNRLEWSDELYSIYGLDKSDFQSNSDEIIAKTTHPDDVERIIQLNKEGIKEKRLFSYEYRIVRTDKKIRDIWVEVGEYTEDENGEVISLSGITQDITDKKEAERELRKSENLLQRIYDLLPVGLWITDEKGKLIRSNKMVTEIWGKDILVSEAEFNVFKGRRLPSREEIKPDDWASVHTIRDGVTIRDEMIEIDAYDGKTKTILNYTTPILDDDGKKEGAIILNLDITELKKAEELLSAQLDELRRWNLATLGRENRIRELKAEINKLLIESGKEPIYKSVADDDNA